MKHLLFHKNKFLLILYIYLLSNLYADIEVIVNADKDFLDKNSFQTVFLSDLSIKEKIKLIPGFNAISKGFSLTQMHVSINGGSFEQTGIFIEGVKFNDPQTGHFNWDLPFTLLDIEKINLINRATTILGSGALNGLLNIKLKDIKKDSFEFLTEYGTYNTLFTGIRLTRKIQEGGFSISTEKSFSDGYHYDTDFDKQTFFISGNYKMLKAQLGYDEKKYGAFDYYTPGKNMPSFEYVITRYGKIGIDPIDGLEISSYIRTHSDRFTLNRDFPSYYQNQHLNINYGGFLKYDLYISSDKNILFKYDFSREEINSQRLGNHHRIKNTVLINTFFSFFDNLESNINLSFENYNLTDVIDLLPSFNMNYDFDDNLSLNSYYAYSARYPNFTELYYQDPYNSGNDALSPEKSHEIGIGGVYKLFNTILKLNLFYKNTFNLIEWSKENISDIKWQIRNTGENITKGINSGIEYDIFEFLKIILTYSYLDSNRSEPYIPKYGFSYLKNRIGLIIEMNIFKTLFKLEYLYKNYIERSDIANMLDLYVDKDINDWLKILLKFNNILNYYFEETKGIPAPGRIISGKVTIKF